MTARLRYHDLDLALLTGRWMITPQSSQSSLASSPTSLTRRVFDLLVIVTIAAGLLALAGQVASQRGREEATPLANSLDGNQLPDTPELQLLLPLEQFGMVLTREHVEGHSEQALVALEQRCAEVLTAADEWVLSLVVSSEEEQLLNSLVGTESLPGPLDQPKTSVRLFPLTQPTGRAGVRGITPTGHPVTPAVESSQTAKQNMGEREQEEQSPSDDSGSGALAGRRLICWGFIVSDGAGGHTVWFARPREKLPRSVLQEGHVP